MNIWALSQRVIAELRDLGFELEGEGEVFSGIMDDAREGVTDGKAPPPGQHSNRNYGNSNTIPGYPGNTCFHTLYVYCYNKDNIHERLRQMVYHAGITCRGHNRQVIFVTTSWDPRTYIEWHEDAVNGLRTEGVRVAFILLTKRGMSVIPV